MKLTVIDRVLLPSLLPKKGKLIEMMIVQDILDKIRFSGHEISDYELKDHPNGGVTFNKSKAKEITFDFNIEHRQVMDDAVRRLDEASEVSLEILSLIRKIRNV